MIPLFKVFMAPEATEEVGKVLNSGYIGQGEKVEEFEDKLGSFFGNDNLVYQKPANVVTVNSCTSAIHLALRLVEYRFPNESIEVLSTPLTCFATNAPILANNYGIKWVDVEEETLNMDLDDLERKLSPTTKVIMLVHWGGCPINLNRVNRIKERCYDRFGFRPIVIEDCAHAMGAEFDGKKIGTHGNICCFSFQAIKHLTCVDGGCLIIPDKGLYKQAKLLRWYGMDRENCAELRCQNDVPNWGYKFHMNDVNATIGLCNFEYLEQNLTKHQENSKFYNEYLSKGQIVGKPDEMFKYKSAAWVYTLLVENKHSFSKRMKDAGIHSTHVHERNDKYSTMKSFKACLPTLDRIHHKIMCIPVGWWVDEYEREHIVNTINKGW